ncbi:Pacrg, partial [Symbiodinium microadriaticum]
MAKDYALQAAGEYFSSAGGKGDPEVERQCHELYGLFQRKNVMEAHTDRTLKRSRGGKSKPLANLEGDKAPGGLFIQHTASHQWYHCFILGKKEDAQLQCVAMEPDWIFQKTNRKLCGLQSCDYDRLTFKTECLDRVVGWIPRSQCVYVGHHGQVHPKDMMGTPVPYSVYIMGCPPIPPTPPLRKLRT